MLLVPPVAQHTCLHHDPSADVAPPPLHISSLSPRAAAYYHLPPGASTAAAPAVAHDGATAGASPPAAFFSRRKSVHGSHDSCCSTSCDATLHVHPLPHSQSAQKHRSFAQTPRLTTPLKASLLAGMAGRFTSRSTTGAAGATGSTTGGTFRTRAASLASSSCTARPFSVVPASASRVPSVPFFAPVSSSHADFSLSPQLHSPHPPRCRFALSLTRSTILRLDGRIFIVGPSAIRTRHRPPAAPTHVTRRPLRSGRWTSECTSQTAPG
mmetsp:Transcript_42378/g.83254  ORF Transcript_42378/g.83254 Transcript_42378/m.83254 type:complete len:268 (-) Transcript_42378:649-1452(-)